MTPELLQILTVSGAGAVSCAALAAGAFGAQLAGPSYCGWPARSDELMLRVGALRQINIGRRRVMQGAPDDPYRDPVVLQALDIVIAWNSSGMEAAAAAHRDT